MNKKIYTTDWSDMRKIFDYSNEQKLNILNVTGTSPEDNESINYGSWVVDVEILDENIENIGISSFEFLRKGGLQMM